MTTEKPVEAESRPDGPTEPVDGGASASAKSTGTPDAAAKAASPDRSPGRSAWALVRRRAAGAPWWQQAIALVVVAVVAAALIRALFVQVYTVPTASMEPTLDAGSRIVVAKPPYWFGSEPSRGDIVVFKDPGGWLGNSERGHTGVFGSVLSALGLYSSGGHLVKRVIGVGGDTVTCCDIKHRIQVNGYSLDETSYTRPTYPDGTRIPCAGPMYLNCTWTSGVIPAGHVFVMGDYRGDSSDSTAHLGCTGDGSGLTTSCTDSPYVPDSLIVGKVETKGFFSHLSTPSDFARIPDPN